MGNSVESSLLSWRGGMSTTRGADRRRYPRIQTAWPVIVEAADGRVGVGQVVDASLTGMRVATDLLLSRDTAVVLRVSLPTGAGRLEMLATVVRRHPDGLAVRFLTEADEAERVAPFMAPGDIRRWAKKVPVSLPVRIEVGSGEEETVPGRTVDLSASGARITTSAPLGAGDIVILELPGPDVGATLRLPAIVWETYTGGAVVVFANLAVAERQKLRGYLSHFA